MASSSLADLKSGVPGDYVIHRQTYGRADAFQADLESVKQFCQTQGFFFEAVAEPATKRPMAFFVHIRRH